MIAPAVEEPNTVWRGPVRVIPAPALDPAFDDEQPGTAGLCQGQLAMPATSARRALARQPRGDPQPPAGSDATVAPAKAPAAVVGASVVAARRFVEACVEVLNGFRPIAHLRPHTSPIDFTTVVDHLTRRSVRLRMAGDPEPLSRTRVITIRPADADEHSRVRLRRLRICEPRDGVVEAAAVLDHRGGSWAMAIRLERRRGCWLCASLQVI
jgi:hypothetical protein